MKTPAKVVTAIFALLAFAASFLVVTAELDVYQPAAKASTTTIHFVVTKTDSTRTIADRLQSLGLIRNALLFREYAHYVKKLDTKLEPGNYDLTPTMTMDQIIAALLKGAPTIVTVCIPPGLRVTEYPTYFADHNLDGSDKCKSTLAPNFDASVFLKAAKTGVLPDGSKASDDFWYVMPPQKDVAYALEGYLFADTYQIDTTWDMTQLMRHLIATWGANLCPGPGANPYQYVHDQTQCKAHATTISVGGKDVNIFTAMEQQFSTTDDRQALYDALTLSSIVVREAGQNKTDVPGIAAVYYNRYYVMQNDGNVSPVDNATIASFDADPTVWYANDTDNPPADGKWWQDPQKGGGKLTDPNNPYNTYTHDGLPPGPIATPLMADLTGVLQASAPNQSSSFYFFADPCHVTHYAGTQAEQDANVAKYQNAKC